MKVYSPSQTVTHLRCPMLNSLSREGWRSRDQGKSLLAQIVGKAIAAGLGIYNGYRKQLEHTGRQIDSLTPEERQEIAKLSLAGGFSMLTTELDTMQAVGYVLAPECDPFFKSMQDRIGKSIVQYIAADPIAAAMRIIDVERSLGPKYGDCRPDLVVQERDDYIVVDYKSTSDFKQYYHESNLSKYANSFQLNQYTWASGETYGHVIPKYAICMIYTQPVKIFYQEFAVKPEALTLWHQTAQSTWSVMEQIELGMRPPMAAEHEDRFGKCQMYDACFRYLLDPDLMKSKYVNIKDIKNDRLREATREPSEGSGGVTGNATPVADIAGSDGQSATRDASGIKE
jgi:PD-(D/E)XK nuclease superfamily